MKFTASEYTILICLMQTDGLVPTERLHHALYGTLKAAPSHNAVQSFIHRLRDKLTPNGIAIQCKPGRGYGLTDTDKAKLLRHADAKKFCPQF